MRTFLALNIIVALALLTTGCAKDINNKEAVKQAVVEYFAGKQQAIGLDMNMFDIEIGSMSFQKDQATANIFIKPKAGGEGMQLTKVLEREGEKWVVKRSVESGSGGGHGSTIPPPSPSGGALPDGHPAVPAK